MTNAIAITAIESAVATNAIAVTAIESAVATIAIAVIPILCEAAYNKGLKPLVPQKCFSDRRSAVLPLPSLECHTWRDRSRSRCGYR